MQKRICTISGKAFTVSDLEEQFCLAHQLPLPDISPTERLRQIGGFLSSIFLYTSRCAYTGKSILTFVPPHKNLPVYDIDIWMSDVWEALDFGQAYDFSRPFFDQFGDLLKKVPWPSLECVRSTMENSDYTNGVMNVKDCYLSFGIIDSRDVLFSRTVIGSKDIMDSVYVTNSELCFGCIQVNNCYNVSYSQDCSNCSDSAFLFDCRNCKHCFGSSNLSNKEYYFRNTPCTPAEYQEKISKINLGSYKVVMEEKQKFAVLQKKALVKYIQGKSNEDSDGNYLEHTKNCHNCSFVSDAENSEWCVQMVHNTRNAFVCDGFGHNGENLYYSAAVGDNAYNLKFCYDCYSNVRDLEYCIFVGFGSMDCFGCIGLKRKQYCILNKQYTKDEYFALLAKIKEHMRSTGEYGQFFPPALSPMDYNRSEAQVFFPESHVAAEKLGYTWKEDQVEPFTQTYSIPDDIQDVQDDILEAVLKCEVTGKKYKIIKQELAAYRKMGVPIPTVSPIARLEKIQSSLTVKEAKSQPCSVCHQPILTVYDTEEYRIVCESCYQQATQ